MLDRAKTAFWLLVIVAAFWVTAALYVGALSDGSPLTVHGSPGEPRNA